MHEYDLTLKLLLQGTASQTMRLLTGTVVEKWLNVELPKVQSARVDLLGETKDGALIHLELQSTNDATMALRMAEYCLAVFRRLRRFPRQIVVYVGEEPLRMTDVLKGPDLEFRYKLLDIRELDGQTLLASTEVSDNVIGILAWLPDRSAALRHVLDLIADLETDQRVFYLRALLIVAGLRGLEEFVEQEARKVPVLNDILENKVLGREFKKGQLEGRLEGERTLLRRQLEKRFGSVPDWAGQRLSSASVQELEELGVRLLDAPSLEDLLK
jgi:predicted transposase YdaD